MGKEGGLGVPLYIGIVVYCEIQLGGAPYTFEFGGLVSSQVDWKPICLRPGGDRNLYRPVNGR